MLTRSDLEQFSFDALRDLARDGEVKSYIIRTTSGTSGRGPLVMVSKRKVLRGNTPLITFAGVKRPLMCVGSASARLLNALLFLENTEHNNGEALFLNADDIQSFVDNNIFIDFKPDSIVGIPSFVARILQYNIPHDTVLSGIKKIILNGEPLTETLYNFIKLKCPNAELSMLYAAAEVGGIAAHSCGFLRRNEYHPFKDVTVEIINTDEHGVGDIIVSKKISPSVEINQYNTGDVGRLSSALCPCGASFLFEIFGRKGTDYIKVAGAMLHQEELARVASELKEFIIDFRAEARVSIKNNLSQGEVHLMVIPQKTLLGKKDPHNFLAREFSKRLFVTPQRTLEDLVLAGDFLPLQVSFATHPFSKTHKEIKLKYIS